MSLYSGVRLTIHSASHAGFKAAAASGHIAQRYHHAARVASQCTFSAVATSSNVGLSVKRDTTTLLRDRRASSSSRSIIPPGSRGIVTMTRRPEQPEDEEVFDGDAEPSIILSERAIKQLAKVADKEKNPQLALRIGVEPGGCHGYQYKMELTDDVEDDDFRFSDGDNVHVLVDSVSLRLIKGSTIDYVTELIGSQFAIFNNPQAKGAGCGCGVSWEPNI